MDVMTEFIVLSVIAGVGLVGWWVVGLVGWWVGGLVAV